MNKGISPLVAVVLLIAITMTIAGVLAYWASGFIRTQLPALNQTSREQLCAGANFELLSTPVYNSTTGSMVVIAQNTAQLPLTIINAQYIYSNGTVFNQTVNQNLPPGNTIVGFTVTGIGSGYSSYKICTDCPGLCRP